MDWESLETIDLLLTSPTGRGDLYPLASSCLSAFVVLLPDRGTRARSVVWTTRLISCGAGNWKRRPSSDASSPAINPADRKVRHLAY